MNGDDIPVKRFPAIGSENTPIRLECWSVGVDRLDPFTPPELEELRLHGKVYGHPRFADGDEVTTSPIISHDYPHKTVRTANSTYLLGKIDPDYLVYLRQHGIKPESFNPEDFA